MRAGTVDLQPLGSERYPDQWYSDVCYQIQDSLDICTDAIEWWSEHKELGPNQRFMRFLEDVVLEESADGQNEATAARVAGSKMLGGDIAASKVVIFFDEIDSVLNLPFSDDFFTTLRSIFNARATKPKLKRLTFVLIGVASPSQFIKDPTRTPFNIGTSIMLMDFAPEAVQEFKKVLGEGSEALIDRIFYWTSGQPLMVQALAAAIYNCPPEELCAESVDEEVEKEFFKDKIEQNTHFKFIQDYLLGECSSLRQLLRLYRGVLRGQSIPFDEKSSTQKRLRLAGVVRVSDKHLEIRNHIYERVFGLSWIKANMPADHQRWIVAGMSTVAITAILWMIAQPLLFPSFPNMSRIVRYSEQPSVEFEVPLNSSNVSRVTLTRASGKSEILYETSTRFTLSQSGTLRHTLAGLPVGEHEHKLTLFGGWPMQSRVIPIRTVYYPSWEIHQFPDKRLQEIDPIYEVDSFKVTLRDATNGQFLGTIENLTASITSNALSANRSNLLIGDQAGGVKLWRLEDVRRRFGYGDRRITASLLQTIVGHDKPISVLAFEPGGKVFASGSRDHSIKLWDTSTGHMIGSHPLTGHNGAVTGLVFAPDGKHLFSSGTDGQVKKWNLITHRMVRDYVGHSGSVTSLTLSKNGDLLISGGEDGSVRVWDTTAGNLAHRFEKQVSSVNHVSVSSDGQLIASAAVDGAIWLMSLKTGDSIKLAQSDKRPASILGFSSNHNLLHYNKEGKNHIILDLGARDRANIFRPFSAHILSVNFSQDGSYLAVSGSDQSGPISVIDLESMRISGECNPGGGAASWSPIFLNQDKLIFATAGLESENDGVYVCNLNTGGIERLFSAGGTVVYSLSQSPDKTLLAASVLQPPSVIVWDLVKGQRLWKLNSHEIKGENDFSPRPGVFEVSFSKDGKVLASSGGDGTIILWDMESGTEIDVLRGHTREVESVDFSPQDDTLVSADSTGVIRHWDAISGVLRRTFTGHKNRVMKVRFSPDGKHIVSASDDMTVKLWDVASGQLLREYRGHSTSVTDAAFSPDGRWVVSAGRDGLVKFWWALAQ